MRTEWTEIADHRVKICTGRHTQTINICAPDNSGDYIQRFRIATPALFLTAFSLATEGFNELEELGTFLQTTHSASDISNQSPQSARRAWEYLDPDPVWGAARLAAVNRVVLSLATEFRERRFRHRSEHSLHCELYDRLRQIPEIRDGRIAIERGEDTDLVHKEWPESGIRPEKDGRGNFDVAILTPRTAPVEEERFLRGYIKPYFAFELGLDYSCDHFLSDINKLRQHAIPVSYSIHFARPRAADQERVEELVATLRQRDRIGRDNWPRLAVVILKADSEPFIHLPA